MPTSRRRRPASPARPGAAALAAVVAALLSPSAALADPPARPPAAPTAAAPDAESPPGRVRVDYDRFLDRTAVRLDAGPFAFALSHDGREPADGAVDGVDLLVAAGPRRVVRVIFLIDGDARIIVGDREGPSRLSPDDLARVAGAARSVEAALFTEGDGRTEYVFTPADRAGLAELQRRAGRAAEPAAEADPGASEPFPAASGAKVRLFDPAPDASPAPAEPASPTPAAEPLAEAPAAPDRPGDAVGGEVGVVRPVVVVIDLGDWALLGSSRVILAEVRRAFDGAKEGQKFNVLTLGAKVQSLSAFPVPTTAANAGRLNDFLARLQIDLLANRTFLEGLRSAVGQRPSGVTFITDGDVARDHPDWEKDVAFLSRVFDATGTELHLVLTGDAESPSRDALERIARRNGSVRRLEQAPAAVRR